MTFALAQIRSKSGDIDLNIELHKTYIRQAVEKGVDLICFPELSLTGYEPKLAKDLALRPDDKRLDQFQRLSDQHNMLIALGAPLKGNDKPFISLILFRPLQSKLIYHKQYLHQDETPYFELGSAPLVFELKGHSIAIAICYEAFKEEHHESAAELSANIYLASVAKPEQGIQRAFNLFPQLAKAYEMTILMVNAVGPSDDFISAGKSGVWDSKGTLVSHLNTDEEGLLLFDTEHRDIEKII